MAEKQGYIKLYRKLQESWLWQDKPFSRGQAWVDLILLANHKEQSFMINGGKVDIPVGGLVTSLRKLSERWGWSISKVSRFLKLLERESMITEKRDTQKTVIFLENYGVLQGKQTLSETQKEHQKDTGEAQKKNRRKTGEKQTKTNKNDKEYIENEEECKEGGHANFRPSGINPDYDPEPGVDPTWDYYKQRGGY